MVKLVYSEIITAIIAKVEGPKLQLYHVENRGNESGIPYHIQQ